MSLDEIVARIQDDLNLSSTASATRIADWVNRGYKQICTDPFCGIDTIGEVLGVEVSTVIGTNQLTWSATTTTPATAVQKILRMYNPDTTPALPVIEVSVDEIRNGVPGSDPAQRWARLAGGSSSVTVLLDVTPASVYTLTADVLSNQITLTGSAEPAFAEDFHDLLIYFGKWQELKKMKDYAGAKVEEEAYHGVLDANGNYTGGRLSQFRLFCANSGHKKFYQGKTVEQGTVISARI